MKSNNSDFEKETIKGLDNKRVVDATALEYKGLRHLFFDEKNTAHPILNPFLIKNDKIFRFGQNNNRKYGSSLTISKIAALNATSYEERECDSLKISDGSGPHTIDFDKDMKTIFIDCYEDRFSFFAGIRRFKALASGFRTHKR